jgi:two-component system sensor histidine kinase QseC
MKGPTLLLQLFIALCPVLLVTVVIIGGLALRSAVARIDAAFDAQLMNNAGLLSALAEDEISEGDAPAALKKISYDAALLFPVRDLSANPLVGGYASSRMFRIWRRGAILMASETAPPPSLPAFTPGFRDASFRGEPWRVFSFGIRNKGVSIEVGEKIALRRDLALDILANILMPLLFLAPALGLLLWIGIRQGLAPIRLLVRQIRDRSPDDLSPLPLSDLPADLRPLGASVNLLLERLGASLTAERNFADQAAHQLRTPLAGLKLQLQALALTRDEQERARGVANLLAATDRASGLVRQLLDAARVSHAPVDIRSIALYPLVASVVAEMGAMIAQRGLDVSLAGDETAPVKADEPLLRVMTANLLENALKYTPSGGKVEIEVKRLDDGSLLTLSDTGPGIPPEQREQVFRRFHRLETAGVEGSGLGLAIVADIVKRFSGRVTLATPSWGKGLRVEVMLPAGSAAA